MEDALYQVADAVLLHASRRSVAERFVAAALGSLGPEVAPEEAARIAWQRALAALRYADEHAAEVETATRFPARPQRL
jgi:hypothetical protein